MKSNIKKMCLLYAISSMKNTKLEELKNKKQHKATRSRVDTMNDMVRSSEVSGYFKQMNGATVF